MIQTVIINGFPRSGKDTFIELCKKELNGKCDSASSVEFVKFVAMIAGWNGEKTPKNRKFLAELKELLTNWDDIPFSKMRKEFEFFSYLIEERSIGDSTPDALFFFVIREPDEIERAKQYFNAKTLLIRRAQTETDEQSNYADKNVLNYAYDFIIENNGTIEELEESAKTFINLIFNKGDI